MKHKLKLQKRQIFQYQEKGTNGKRCQRLQLYNFQFSLEFVSSLFISFHPSKTVGQEVESSNLLEFSNGKHLKLLFRFQKVVHIRIWRIKQHTNRNRNNSKFHKIKNYEIRKYCLRIQKFQYQSVITDLCVRSRF